MRRIFVDDCYVVGNNGDPPDNEPPILITPEDND